MDAGDRRKRRLGRRVDLTVRVAPGDGRPAAVRGDWANWVGRPRERRSSRDELLERYLGPARATLGDEAESVWRDGRALSFDDAVAIALGDSQEQAGTGA
jgi:hypothetical protein